LAFLRAHPSSSLVSSPELESESLELSDVSEMLRVSYLSFFLSVHAMTRSVIAIW
jgi:hypothetical protein